MFSIRMCSICGIRIRATFGTRCRDCDARQRARDLEENARLRRRVHFDDEPVIINRSPSPCRLRIRRSSPRNNHADNDRSLVQVTTACTSGDDDSLCSVVDVDDDDDWFRRPGTSNTVTRYWTNARPGCWDRDRDVERARLREARDRGVNENGTRWSSHRLDYERERHDRFGGHEYDRQVNWEIRRDHPSRRRDRDIFDLFCEF